MITIDSIRSANSAVEIQTAAGQALAIDGSGFLTITNSSFAVTATDLDIRNLVFATDKADVSGSEISLDAATLAALETTTVVATQLDIDDLEFAVDSVTAHQGGSWAVTIDNISSWKNTAETATTTVGELVATPFASRSSMNIQNLGNQDVYLGPDNAVTAANGMLLPKGSSLEVGFDLTANIFAITATGTADLRVSEYAA